MSLMPFGNRRPVNHTPLRRRGHEAIDMRSRRFGRGRCQNELAHRLSSQLARKPVCSWFFRFQ